MKVLVDYKRGKHIAIAPTLLQAFADLHDQIHNDEDFSIAHMLEMYYVAEEWWFTERHTNLKPRVSNTLSAFYGLVIQIDKSGT